MKTFGQAAEYFRRLAAGGYKAHLEAVLDLIGREVKAECEREIGTYMGAIGQYPATAPLEQSTIDRKGNDDPLFRTGIYHDSIETYVDRRDLSVEIGTNVDYVVYHELGTSHNPPRPIFGPATLRTMPRLQAAITQAAGMGVMGGVWADLEAEGLEYTSQTPDLGVIP